MVEFALILPILMSLVLGTVTGGAAYNRKIAMSGAVREGARFGATLPASADWANDVRSRTVALASGELNLGPNVQVCVSLFKEGTGAIWSSSSPGCTLPAADTPATPAGLTTGECVVKVWAQRSNDKLQAMFFTKTLTLKASSVARFEGTSC